MTKSQTLYIIFVACLLLLSFKQILSKGRRCEDNETEQKQTKNLRDSKITEPEQNSIFSQFEILKWSKPEKLNKGLPPAIQVFESNSSISAGVPLHSVYALIDLSDIRIKYQTVYGNSSIPRLTPQQYAQQQKAPVYAVLNGGYFNMQTGESQSLIIHDSILIHQNVINEGTYRPTIGTFAVWEDRSMQSLWTYNPNNSFTWGYQQPAWNSRGQSPLPAPNATWPQGAATLTAQQVISGGPLLLKNGVYYNGTEEMFNDNILYNRHPRSAVCKTKDNKLVLFAGDGRQSFSTGLWTNETAAILYQIGCVDGINLDGGGSTCLYVNGQIANSPSDKEGPRAVSTALMVLADYIED